MESRYSRESGHTDIAASAARLARARRAFDEGLQQASRAGEHALRRALARGAWGAALFGGAAGLFLIARLLRRERPHPISLRLVIEQRPAPNPLLPLLGAALARFALQQLTPPQLPAPAANHGALPVQGTLESVPPTEGVAHAPSTRSTPVPAASAAHGRVA